MNRTATIQLRNLTIGYKGKVNVKIVAENICSDIYAGELTCLLGTNGIGKSTLLRTLSAFQPKLSGEIRLSNKEIRKIYGPGTIYRNQCRPNPGKMRYP